MSQGGLFRRNLSVSALPADLIESPASDLARLHELEQELLQHKQMRLEMSMKIMEIEAEKEASRAEIVKYRRQAHTRKHRQDEARHRKEGIKRKLFSNEEPRVKPVIRYMLSKTTINKSDAKTQRTRKQLRLAKAIETVMEHRFKAPAEDILMSYFSRHAEELKTIVNQVNGGKVAKEIKEGWSKAISAALKDRCIAIHARLIPSERKWMRFKHMFRDNYDAYEDTFEPMLVEGVPLPQLASLKYLRDNANEHRAEMGIQSMQKGASMSMVRPVSIQPSRQSI